jgi:hypothetical protein
MGSVLIEESANRQSDAKQSQSSTLKLPITSSIAEPGHATLRSIDDDKSADKVVSDLLFPRPPASTHHCLITPHGPSAISDPSPHSVRTRRTAALAI